MAQTQNYDLLSTTAGPWDTWIGEVKPMSQVSMTCNECSGRSDCNYRGECRDEVCDCDDGHFGETCEFQLPCEFLASEKANTLDFANGSVEWKQENPIHLWSSGGAKMHKVYNRPVYIQKSLSGEPYDMRLYKIREKETASPSTSNGPTSISSQVPSQLPTSFPTLIPPPRPPPPPLPEIPYPTEIIPPMEGMPLPEEPAPEEVDGDEEGGQVPTFGGGGHSEHDEDHDDHDQSESTAAVGGDEHEEHDDSDHDIELQPDTVPDSAEAPTPQYVSPSVAPTTPPPTKPKYSQNEYDIAPDFADWDDFFESEPLHDLEEILDDYSVIISYSGSRFYGTIIEPNATLEDLFPSDYHAFWSQSFDLNRTFIISDTTLVGSPVGIDFFEMRRRINSLLNPHVQFNYGPFGALIPLMNYEGSGFFHCLDEAPQPNGSPTLSAAPISVSPTKVSSMIPSQSSRPSTSPTNLCRLIEVIILNNDSPGEVAWSIYNIANAKGELVETSGPIESSVQYFEPFQLNDTSVCLYDGQYQFIIEVASMTGIKQFSLMYNSKEFEYLEDITGTKTAGIHIPWSFIF